MQYKILFVDDENANLRLLERLFRDNYEVHSAASAQEALELLVLHDFALIVSDQRMPGMTGIEFLNRASEMRPQTVRIMLTGYTDANALVEALNSGIVYKYVTKPWINEDFQQTVKRALQHYETLRAQRSLQLQNERLQLRVKATREGFIEVVADMLELKDPHARAHARRTSEYAAKIGHAIKMDRADIEQLSLAAFLHEAALFRIPNHILLKETPLNLDEQDVVRRNFEPGLEMIARIPDLVDIAAVLGFHYENFDGSGVPDGFAGEQIPLHARIIAIADAYDAMTAPRSIKPGLSHRDALAALKTASGKKFDSSLVAVFCSLKFAEKAVEREHELVMA
jgi:response regulator RpfG family c-di-GMP phosphodiesterase